MGWNRFSGSLAFGAVAAAGYAPFALLFAPHLGSGAALGCYALLSVSVYAGGLGATRRQGIGAALLAGALGCAVLLVAPSARDLVLAAALILGLVRNALAHLVRRVDGEVSRVDRGGVFHACDTSARGARAAVDTQPAPGGTFLPPQPHDSLSLPETRIRTFHAARSASACLSSATLRSHA